jgi:hypothetical protein
MKPVIISVHGLIEFGVNHLGEKIFLPIANLEGLRKLCSKEISHQRGLRDGACLGGRHKPIVLAANRKLVKKIDHLLKYAPSGC